MEDNTQLLYKTLTDKGLYTKTYDEFVSKYSNPESRRLMFDVVSKEGLYTKTYEEFTGKYFPEPIKKKVSTESPLESATKGETVLQELGQPSKESITPKLPFQEPKVKKDTPTYEATLPQDLTLNSIGSADKSRADFINDEAEKIEREGIDRLKEEFKQLSETYKGNDLEAEKEKLIDLRTAEIQKAIDNKYKDANYKFIKDDVKDLTSQIEQVLNSGIDHAEKDAKINAIRESVVSQIPQEAQAQVNGEINKLISDVSSSTPLGEQFILKKTTSDALTKLKDAQSKIREEYLSKFKYPETSPMGGGYIWDSNEQMEAFTKFRDDDQKLAVAQNYLQRALNVPESKEGAGKKAFKNELDNILTAGLSGMVESIVTAQGASQQAKGVKNEANDAILNAYGLLQTVNQIASEGIPRFRRATSIAGSLPYMEQFLLTGGIGTGASATATNVGKAMMAKGIKNRIAQGAVKRVVTPVIEGAISMVGRVPLSPATYGNIAKESIGDLKVEDGQFVVDPARMPKISEAIATGTYNSAKEIFSESLGGMIDFKLPKILNRAITPNVKKFFKMAGMNNPFGEYYEEMVSQALGGENPADPEFLKDLVFTIPAMTGGFAILTVPSVGKEMRLRANAKDVIDKFGKDNISDLRDLIEMGEESAVVSKLQGLAQNADITQKDLSNLLKYSGSLVQENTIKEMEAPVITDKGTAVTEIGALNVPPVLEDREPIEAPFKIGDQSFATKEELFKHLDEVALDKETGKISTAWISQEEASIPNDATVKALNEWQESKNEGKNKTNKVDLKNASPQQKIAQSTNTTFIGTQEGIEEDKSDSLDLYNVDIDGKPYTISVPTGSDDIAVLKKANAKRKEVANVKPAESTESIPLGEEKHLDSTGDIAEPTTEQQLSDIEQGKIVTFNYERDSDIPDVFRDKISSKGEVNGKPFIRVTVAKSLADFYTKEKSSPKQESTLTGQETKPNEGVTEQVENPVKPSLTEENPIVNTNLPQEGDNASMDSKQGENQGETTIVSEAPLKPPKVTEGKETVEEDGDKKPLGAQENALDQIETEEQQILSDIVNENKEFYNVLHGEQAVKNANKFIEEKGIDGAVEDLINKTTDINDYPTRQVARMVMIDHFTRILGNSQETKANKDRAYNLVNKLQQVLSKEANKTGQGNAHLNLWKVMQPAGLLEFTKRKIADFNDSKLKKKYKGGEKTIGQLIDLIYSNINEANKKIIDDILEGKTFEAKIPEEKPNQPRKPAKVRTVPKEQVVAEKNYRKNLLDEYKAKKKQGGAGQLNSSMPLSVEQIELGGNLIASYVRQGYYQVADIIERLKKDFDSVGDKIDDTQVDEILSSKKEGKTTYRSWLTAQEAKVGLKGEMKSLKIKISDIVKMHWSERDALGRTLAQKLIDDAGLTDSEARILEKAILDEYDAMIKQRLDSFKELTDLLGKEKIPTEAKKKLSVMDKMLQMINLGALDENVFRQLFAEKFGLAPELDRNQSNIIMQKAAIVQQMTGKGWFYRDAVIDMAKYMYELVPRKAINEIAETWTALAYTHMLSGIPTSILNLWSAGTNMALKPFRDAVNLSRWIKMAKGRKTKGISDFYMPGGQMYYLPLIEGIGHGKTEAAEIYVNGDITSKYVEEISTANQFKVGQLERYKYGKNRFKPLKVGKVDLNIFNLEKYVSRNLSAQDRLMFNTAFDMEVASILRENLISPTLKGKALTEAVNDYIQGWNIDHDAILAQIEKESKEYEELSGKKVTKRQKRIRLRELIVKEFPITEEQKQEAEALARSNIFTDERGGLIATTAYAIGRLANAHPLTGVVFKPFVPFTKIVGNVVEYMVDYTPFYGFMRANGMSISALKKLVDPLSSSAQMGEKGSNAYYEQMGRAWLGTVSFITLAALLVGNDDDDDIQISGGYNQEGFKKPGRTNVMPKYTLRIKGVDISYLNVPSLAIPLGIIGNFNDALKSGMPEEELNARLAVSILTAAPKENPLIQTMFMVKDMSFVTGVQNFITMVSDASSMEESNWKRMGQTLGKTYLGFALRPLPWNAAMVQQTWKFFDPASYSQKDIQSILAYSAGLQHFRTLEINFPSIDQFGDEVKTYPGEALMPYTFWFDVKGKDARWRFLADNNAIPTKVQNGLTYIETEDGIEKRTMEAKELYLYSREAGNIFNKSVSDYILSDSKKIEKRKNDRITTEDAKLQTITKTGIQEDIDGLWKDARDEAKIRVFSWYDFKKNNEVGWQKMVEEGVLQAPITSTEDVRVDEKEVLDFSREEVQTINDNAMAYYSEWVIKYLNTPKSKEDKSTPILLVDGGQTTVFEKQISEMWAGAKRRAKGELIEKKTKGK